MSAKLRKRIYEMLTGLQVNFCTQKENQEKLNGNHDTAVQVQGPSIVPQFLETKILACHGTWFQLCPMSPR